MLTLMDAANRARFARATERVDAAYRHLDIDDPAIVIQDVNYSITGEEPGSIPDDYFAEASFGTMVDYQVRKIAAHLERYDDDYVPFLFPWYGTGVVPSALGCDILFQPKDEPAVRGADHRAARGESAGSFRRTRTATGSCRASCAASTTCARTATCRSP